MYTENNENQNIYPAVGFRSKLSVKLDELDCAQELKFWCVYAFRCLPYITPEFIHYTEKTSYISTFLSKLFLLYHYAEKHNSSSNIDTYYIHKLTLKNTHTLNAHQFKLESPLKGVRAFIVDMIEDLDVDRYFLLDDVRKIRDKLIVYVPNHSEKLRNILLNDIDRIKSNEHLVGITVVYGNRWNDFIEALYKAGCNFYADCIVEFFDNNFTVSDDLMQLIAGVPYEIYEHASSEVSNYLTKLKHGSKKLNEARIILLGDKGSGKTSLARRMLDPTAAMPNIEESTPGVDISSFKLSDMCKKIKEKDDANVHIWDFAGHTITHAAHRCFLSERCVYVVLCESRKENVQKLDYWLELIRNYGGQSKVFIVVNQQDRNSVRVDENRIKRDFYDNECEFFYFSIQRDNRTKLIEFRDRIAEFISTVPAWNSSQISSDWYRIKECLENEFANQETDYITLEQFYGIAERFDVKDKDDALKALSTLGICLYYPQIDDLKTVVLDPEWITFGIYDIINWLANESNTYKINLEQFENVFSENITHYPKEKHSFLYKLMINYELAYEETVNTLVVPQCMQTDDPVFLPEFDNNYLHMRIEAKNIDGCQIPLPPDLMPRIIVNCHNEMRNPRSYAWRYGAVLFSNENTAVICQNGAVLNLKVKGKNASEFNYHLYQLITSVIQNYDSFQKNRPIISLLPFLTDGSRGEMTPVKTINNIAKTNNDRYINPQDNTLLDMLKNISEYSGNIIICNDIKISQN